MEDVRHFMPLKGSFGHRTFAQKWENRVSLPSSISPNTLFWQAMNYLHSSLPKLLKYVRSWSNKGFQSTQPTVLPPVGLLGNQTWKWGKNKGWSRLLKMPETQQSVRINSVKQALDTRQLQETFRHVKTVHLSFRKWCQNRLILTY